MLTGDILVLITVQVPSFKIAGTEGIGQALTHVLLTNYRRKKNKMCYKKGAN
jgi:hypothetical protein